LFVCRQIFCDFGDAFTVSDTDGEQPASVMIAAVTKVMPTSLLLLLLLLINTTTTTPVYRPLFQDNLG